MKELSIEEKAKAYDEAIERANELNYVSDKNSLQCKTVEHIFPELKESEDEKIRKSLIERTKSLNPSHYFFQDLPQDKIIAWLEKQGEQKSAKNIIETWKNMRLEVYQQASGNRHEPNYSDDTTKMFSLNDIDEIIEKMSEQKPAEWSEEDVESLAILLQTTPRTNEEDCSERGIEYFRSIAKDFLNSLKYRCLPPKQEWSEEDERIILKLLEMISTIITEPNCRRFGFDKIEAIDWLKHLKDRFFLQPIQKLNEEDIEKSIEEALVYHDNHGNDFRSNEQINTAFRYGFESGINRLKSLKDRCIPQSKYEWSKEDKKMLEETIQLIVAFETRIQQSDGFKDVKDWLKSLRPQNKWKPSEEQIEELNFAVTHTIDRTYKKQIKVLEELVEQLKALCGD